MAGTPVSQLDLFGGEPEEPEKPKLANPKKKQEPPEHVYNFDDRCFVLACACLMETTLLGHPVCKRHHTDRVAAIIKSGDWPGMYMLKGELYVLHTTMRIGDPMPTTQRKGPLFKDPPSG